MTGKHESVYPFAIPNPNMTLLWRSQAFVIAGLIFASGCIWYVERRGYVESIPICVLIAAWIAIPLMAVPALLISSYSFKRSAVLMTGEKLIIKPWGSRKDIPWRDVVSITLDTYEGRNSIERMMRGTKGVPCAKVALSRSRFGLTAPGTNFVVLYVQNVEEFVQEAQQHLTGLPA